MTQDHDDPGSLILAGGSPKGLTFPCSRARDDKATSGAHSMSQFALASCILTASLSPVFNTRQDQVPL
jgi:hypothetical protein